MRWVPNPLEVADDKSDFGMALKRVQAIDYCYQYNLTRPNPGFSYSLSALDTLRYLAFRVIRWQDIWELPIARARLFVVVDAFDALARDHRFIPVFLIMPVGLDLRRSEQGSLTIYADFLHDLKKAFADRMVIIDVLE